VYLCHNGCGTLAGVTYALPRQPFAGALATVRDFLRDNPLAVVTIFLEDYSTTSDLKATLEQVPDVLDLIFDPSSPDWAVKQRGWPTLRALTMRNKRLLVLTDNWQNDALYGIHYDEQYTVQNTYDLGQQGSDYSCVSRWGDVIPLNQQEQGWSRLFLMSHFRGVALAANAGSDNSYANLQRRVDQYCTPAVGRVPNYISVDFFESPNGDPQRYVDDLNAAR
jgi:hypothetical protein